MASIVLVHGAFHGGWCWEKVVPLLEAAGHAHPDVQANLAKRAGAQVDWPTSHSPFYSQPQLVADLLVKLAG